MSQLGIAISSLKQFHVRCGVVTLYSLYNNVESEHDNDARYQALNRAT
jgi:hypothetical protein